MSGGLSGNFTYTWKPTLHACNVGGATVFTSLLHGNRTIGSTSKFVRVTEPPTTATPLMFVSDPPDETLYKGQKAFITLPSAKGGTPDYSYSVDGLPRELIFTESTRTIKGKSQVTGMGDIDETDVISGAVSRWNGVSAGVSFKEYSPDPPKYLATDSCSIGKKDSVLKITDGSRSEMLKYCESSSALACVRSYANGSHYRTQSFLYRAVLNGGQRWSTDKDDSKNPDEDYVYMPVVFMHELGHAAGLAHSPDKSAAMYKWEQNKVQDLTSDDIAAMKALYKGHTAH